MTTRIHLIRHGATMATTESIFAGAASDVPLSDEGRAQAVRLAARLADAPIVAAYASPQVRALETARILSQPHGLSVVQREALKEIDHGHWDGLSRAEVERRFTGEYSSWEQDPFTFAPAGGETGLAVTARALPALLEVVRSHPDQHVIVVSHKATIRLLLCSILGFDPRTYRDHLDQSPCALNILDFRDTIRARLMLFNDTSHYAPQGMAIPAMPGQRLSKWWDTGADAR
jgi:probable phosphoglycerate mutase